jgi:hypothetical protein
MANAVPFCIWREIMNPEELPAHSIVLGGVEAAQAALSEKLGGSKAEKHVAGAPFERWHSTASSLLGFSRAIFVRAIISAARIG